MKIPGFFSESDTEKNIEASNKETGYSEKLELFRPVDIKLLMNLSDIRPEIKEFEDSEIEKDMVCQMVISPNGEIKLGHFNKRGGGAVFLTIKNSSEFIEGKHFEFVP